MKKDIIKFRKKGDYHIILDPQLYLPRSVRGKIQEHPYFPSDLDTAELSSNSWWEELSKSITRYANNLKVDAITTPVILPRKYDYSYYSKCSKVSDSLKVALEKHGIETYSTVLVDINSMADEEHVFKVASIMTEYDANGYYIVIDSDRDPRHEFNDSEGLFGIMMLIKELKNANRPILVSNCSSDMLLYKVAQATSCCTGKFFNLRRFSKSRFEEPASGGGQLPYWFEHSLIAFIRESDILRLKKEGYENLLMQNFSKNYWANKIIGQLEREPEKAWLALGWRQYLSWFGKAENKLNQDDCMKIVKKWLKLAEGNWLQLEDNDVLFEEPRNTGSWLRPWRQAISRFSKKYNL